MSELTRLAPMDPGKNNSPVNAASEEDSTLVLDTAKKVCIWNDEDFDDGARICSDGSTYECSFGTWVKINDSC